MGPDVLRRIRWGNVGRLAGALAVAAAVVAWPRLAPPEPALPGESARPLDGLPAPGATPPAELLVPHPPRGTRRPGGRQRRSASKPDRDGPRERRRPRARQPRRDAGGPADVSRSDDADAGDANDSSGAEKDAGRDGAGGDDPAQSEFGFERG